MEELRGCKPTPQRLAHAQRHQGALERKVAADAKRADELLALQQQLAKDTKEHSEKAAKNAADLAAAKQEVGRLAGERAREQGAGAPEGVAFASQDHSFLTALFKLVSEEDVTNLCAQHGVQPEDVKASTEALLAKVQAHSKVLGGAGSGNAMPGQAAAPPASGPQGQERTETMEIDDDLLGQMAEAAVAPAGEGGSAAEERTARVAEAKARLKSKKSDLEQGLAKVRKVVKKGGA